jgi:glycine hydroxymethyltransferase
MAKTGVYLSVVLYCTAMCAAKAPVLAAVMGLSYTRGQPFHLARLANPEAASQRLRHVGSDHEEAQGSWRHAQRRLPLAWAANGKLGDLGTRCSRPTPEAVVQAARVSRCPPASPDLRQFRFVFTKTLVMFERSRYTIDQIDPEIFAAIQKENQRQEDHIELIASENYTSPAVMAAQGSQLTNKYAEGYPGKRYYGGCEYVDVVEQLAIDRVKQLFGAEAANVQPNSGSQANQGVFFAVLKPGDTIMGMSLAEGGHLTHGMALNMSGKWFNVVSYGLNAQEDIDYDALEALAQEKKPKLIIAGASAFALRIDFERIGKIAKSIGAYFMVDMAHYAGLIAAGVYPNPVPHADFVTTTTHKSLRGPRGGVILMKAEHEKAINSAIFPGIQGGPLMHVIAGKAVAFKEALSPEFKAYQQQVVKNAAAMAETLMARGLRIVSGRTESHVMLVDLRAKKITGKEAEKVLGDAHITVNKNAIPNDPEKPFVTSGIRLGSPAMTTRGFKEAEAVKVAHLIADVLDNPHDENNIAEVRAKVAELTKQFPVYG